MNPFISYPEPKLILCKDNARRAQNKMKRRKTFIFFVEPQLILSKDNANTEHFRPSVAKSHQ